MQRQVAKILARRCLLNVEACLVSLIDPGVGSLGVVAEVRPGEPEPDLVVGWLHWVWAVDDVASNLCKNIFLYTKTKAVKYVTATSEYPVVSPVIQIYPTTGQIFDITKHN